MGYVIEKGIPAPTGARRSFGEPLYPFEKMKVGDSFVVPHNAVNKTRVAVNRFEKTSPWRFCSRMVADGVRVWRVM